MPSSHPRPWHRKAVFGDGPRVPMCRERRAVWKTRLEIRRRLGHVTDGHAQVGKALITRQGKDGRCDPSHETLAADSAESVDYRQAGAKCVSRVRSRMVDAADGPRRLAGGPDQQRLCSHARRCAQHPSKNLRGSNWPRNHTGVFRPLFFFCAERLRRQRAAAEAALARRRAAFAASPERGKDRATPNSLPT